MRPAEWLTRPETADWLGCSVATVDRLIAAGAIEFVRIGGRTRFTPEALERYILSHTVPINDDGRVAARPRVQKHGVGTAEHVRI
jgi:excisionase family DNA binding protein